MDTEEYSPESFAKIQLAIPGKVTIDQGEVHAVRIHTYANLLEHNIVEATISGSWRITYSGDPKVESTVSGSGSIRKAAE